MDKKVVKVGTIVQFFPYLEDTDARSNNNNDSPIPAIVTRVWSADCVNLTIFPDCGKVSFRTSVLQTDESEKGRWRFLD